MNRYRRTASWVLLAALAIWTVGCTMTQQGAGIGAALGAGAGAIFGHNSGAGSGEGALIGAALGGLAGALAGDAIEKHQERDATRYPPPPPPPAAEPGYYPYDERR